MNLLEGTLVGTDGAMRIDFDHFQLDVPADRSERYTSHLGRGVVFGIRPEDITNAGAEPAQGAWCRVRATVAVFLLLGAESILELASGDHQFVARVDAHETYIPQEEIDVNFNMAKCHLFDPVSNEVI